MSDPADHGSNGHAPYDAREMDDWILNRVEQIEIPLAEIRLKASDLATNYREMNGRVNTQGQAIFALKDAVTALDGKVSQVLGLCTALRELLQPKAVL